VSAAKHRQAAFDQRVCAVTGRGGPWHAHHVIRVQDVREGDPHDPRNALRLGVVVHSRHHMKFERVPLTALLATNIEYAFELLGDYAYDYLHRHYSGEDDRVSLRLRAAHG
jgi:hypothetical protein